MSVTKSSHTDPVPDYNVCSEDHRNVLIVVKRIGDKMSLKSFNKIYEHIKKETVFKVTDSGTTRCIKIKYESDYPPENNEWGDFQAHRKVLGFISIGECASEECVAPLCKEHCLLLEPYQSTAYDARCLLFSGDGATPSDPPQEEGGSPASPPPPGAAPLLFQGGGVEPLPESHLGHEDLFHCHYPAEEEGGGDCLDTSSFSPDFSSLPHFDAQHFEEEEAAPSPSAAGSPAHGAPPPAAPSPARSKKFIVPSPSRPTHCVLYQGGEVPGEELREFLHSVFWVLESKRLDRSYERQEKVPLLVAPFERRNFVGIDTDTKVFKRRCLGRLKKHAGDLSLQAGLPLEALSLYGACADALREDPLWAGAALEGHCAASLLLQFHARDFLLGEAAPKAKAGVGGPQSSRSLPLHLDPLDSRNIGRSMLGVDELADKYGEAIAHYQKYHGALIIEMECCMKAVRAFIKFRKYLDATKMLQNVVFTAVVQTEEEKLVRFNALAQVFTEMGFHRKASFFKRIAAMRSVSAINPKPNWNKCYYLLLESLKGYRLPLDVAEFSTETTVGWPTIQVQMLFDIIGVSKMMNNQAISVRHITFVLAALLGVLGADQQRELCRQLEELTARCEGAPVPLSLDGGRPPIPPVNLLNLPTVRSFKLQNLAPHLRPVKMVTNELKAANEHESIFIFSPIPRHSDKSAQSNSNIDFKWVEGDVCEVVLQVFNPLPFELKVTHMGLLADGVPFESFPACLSLPGESGPYPVTLLGKPLDPGSLQVLGYTTHVLGVRSECRLREVGCVRAPLFCVEVVGRLPSALLSTSLPRASTFSSLEDASDVVASAHTTLHNGQSQECVITITNAGKEPVEWVDISMHSKLKKDLESAFFTWDKEEINAQLPIAAGCVAHLTLHINAIGPFILEKPGNPVPLSSASPRRRGDPVLQPPEPFAAKTVEAVLQVQYSGGRGMRGGHCRQGSVALTVEVLPSLVITEWNVLPSEVPTHCYLVLDMQNGTGAEMEVAYARHKRILIEAGDKCRVPVPVQRCSLAPVGAEWASVCGHLWSGGETDARKAALLAACRAHLHHEVDLQWTLPASEISGKASISEITWTEDMLGFILMSPLRWDVRINEKDFQPEMEFNFLLGELVTFSIKLLNVSDVPLLSLNLFVRGYQDYQNGRQSYRLETKRAVSGKDRIHIEEIKPGEEFLHECGFVFFHSGAYKVDILCSHNDPLLDSGGGHPCLIQKCSPTLDLTILED